MNSLKDFARSHPAPPGPDWGWMIELAAAGEEKMLLKMHNITPKGEPYIAVEITLSRAK